MIILSIETSCDETAVAVVEANGDLQSPVFKVLGSSINSQIKMHEEFGGVVPNIAKREHIKNLPIVLADVLQKAGIELENLANKINRIAVTVGPGLEPALWTGITFAKELSEKYKIPLMPANHMEGHIASVLLNRSEKEPIQFPALALLVSGGHTELVLLKNWNEKQIIGETLDDAVGEAFDKVARMLGLPYPGGPEISKLAEKAREENLNLDTKFPRPMIHSKDYNFSFSGLKTSVLYFLKKIPPLIPPTTGGKENNRNSNGEPSPAVGEGETIVRGEVLKKQIAREFEDAVSEVLISKSKRAIEEFDPKTFIIGGGVIANKKIREDFQTMIEEFPEIELLIPEKNLTTDNAVMIAIAAYISEISDSSTNLEMKAVGNLKIGN